MSGGLVAVEADGVGDGIGVGVGVNDNGGVRFWFWLLKRGRNFCSFVLSSMSFARPMAWVIV